MIVVPWWGEDGAGPVGKPGTGSPFLLTPPINRGLPLEKLQHLLLNNTVCITHTKLGHEALEYLITSEYVGLQIRNLKLSYLKLRDSDKSDEKLDKMVKISLKVHFYRILTTSCKNMD